jgi:hypothetical protein
MMPRTARVTAIFALLIIATPAFAGGGGAFTRAAGGSLIRVDLTSISASQIFDYRGTRHDIFDDSSSFENGVYGATDLGFYGELGVTPWLTGIASTQYKVAVREAFQRSEGRDTSASASGLGDLWLYARMRLTPMESRYAATFTLGWKAPLGAASQAIPLGTGSPDYELAGAVGTTTTLLDSIGLRAEVVGGYRMRTRASNEFLYRIGAMVDCGRGFFVLGDLDGVVSTADFLAADADPVNHGLNRSLVGDHSYATWTLGAKVSIDAATDLSASISRPFAGRNYLAGSSITVGIAWNH